jgi:hypothetical protein
MVLGGGLILASFARDLLSLVADLFAVVGGIDSRLPVLDMLFSAPVRVALLVVGIVLVSKSAKATHAVSQDHLAEQAFRSAMTSSLESVLDEGFRALADVPQTAIPGRINYKLWVFVLSQYETNVHRALERFSVVQRVPREIYEADAAECYRLVLELAETARSVLAGNLKITRDIEHWYHRLTTLDPEMRRRLGDAKVDKARALANRDGYVRDEPA